FPPAPVNGYSGQSEGYRHPPAYPIPVRICVHGLKIALCPIPASSKIRRASAFPTGWISHETAEWPFDFPGFVRLRPRRGPDFFDRAAHPLEGVQARMDFRVQVEGVPPPLYETPPQVLASEPALQKIDFPIGGEETVQTLNGMVAGIRRRIMRQQGGHIPLHGVECAAPLQFEEGFHQDIQRGEVEG